MKIYSYTYSSEHTRNDTDRCILESVKCYLTEKGVPLPNGIFVKRTSLGKPYVEGCHNLYVSITHAENLLLTAVSENEVGIDCESKNRSVRDVKALSARFFTPSERDELMGLDTVQRESRFMELWVMKEALVKLSGEGLSAITHTDSQNPPNGVSVELLYDFPDYVTAVALKK